MAAAGRKTNWFAIWVSAAVVVVLIVVGIFVVVLNNQATGPGEAPQASNIDAETGAIHVGDGADVVGTYIDFMCPVCNQFEQTYGETLQGAIDDGSITLDIHPIAILDSQSQGTKFSTRAANAMYCVAVADADAVMPFMQTMYENQPEEGTSGLTDEQILAIAAGVGVSDIDTCVDKGTYSKFVTAQTKTTPPDEQGRIGTPTVVFNGERISLTGDPQVDILDRIGG